VNAIADRYGYTIAHMFHIGDGNLHPVLLFEGTVEPIERGSRSSAAADQVRWRPFRPDMEGPDMDGKLRILVLVMVVAAAGAIAQAQQAPAAAQQKPAAAPPAPAAKLPREPMFVGNAYEAKDVPRVPYSLHEAVETFRGSTVAREAFGDFVFEHLLNTAHQEQVMFDNTTVTDWELARYFERG